MHSQNKKTYAVFSDKNLVYLGEDEVIIESSFKNKQGNIMICVETLSDFQHAWYETCAGIMPIGAKVNRTDLDDVLVKAKEEIRRIMSETFDFNDGAATIMANKVKESGKNLVEECRTMGIQSMKAIGSGLKTLGDFFEKMK